MSLLLGDLIERSGFDVWVAVGTAEEVPVILGTTHHATEFGFETSIPAWAWQLSATVAREETAIVLPHLDEVPDDRRRSSAGLRSGAHGVVGVPILTPEHRALGVLCGLSQTAPDDALHSVLPHAQVVARVIGTVLSHEAEIVRLSWRVGDLEATAQTNAQAATVAGTAVRAIDTLLEATRVQLGLHHVLVGRFEEGQYRIVNAVAAPGEPRLAGRTEPAEGSLARLVVDGAAPGAIPDVAAVPALAHLRLVRELNVRTHVAVPLRRQDGQVFGSICGFSRVVRPDVGPRELASLHVLAQQIGGSLAAKERADEDARRFMADFRELMDGGGPQIVYQPVVALGELRAAGAEALSRFAGSARPPDRWFAQATVAGHGAELELLAIRSALDGLPATQGFLSLNVSPSTVLLPEFVTLLEDQPLARIVLEITEHTEISDYGPLDGVLAPLRARGMRVAVDDVGAGFASMRHILMLAPELIKLDLSLVHGISTDARRRSLAAALLTFAADMGAAVVAEGVETASELDCLRQLGVQYGQGFHLGRPEPLRRDPSA